MKTDVSEMHNGVLLGHRSAVTQMKVASIQPSAMTDVTRLLDLQVQLNFDYFCFRLPSTSLTSV